MKYTILQQFYVVKVTDMSKSQEDV